MAATIVLLWTLGEIGTMKTSGSCGLQCTGVEYCQTQRQGSLESSWMTSRTSAIATKFQPIATPGWAASVWESAFVLTWGNGSAEASRTFSGFRSQWTMFLKWRCLRATRICRPNSHKLNDSYQSPIRHPHKPCLRKQTKKCLLPPELSRSHLCNQELGEPFG